MFLGSDNYKHEDNATIKKCSACGDKNLRYLGLIGNVGGLPVWICGNGHTVYPFYSEPDEWYTYVIYEGGLPAFVFGEQEIAVNVSDYGCCDLPKSGLSKNVYYPMPGENSLLNSEYPCKIPQTIKININGVKGVHGGRTSSKYSQRTCVEKFISDGSPYYGQCEPFYIGGPSASEDVSVPWNYTCCFAEIGDNNCWCNRQKYMWDPDNERYECECTEEEEDAFNAGKPDCEFDETGLFITNWNACKYKGDCFYFKCFTRCTSTPEGSFVNRDHYGAVSRYWMPLSYGDCSNPPISKRDCGPWPVCNDYRDYNSNPVCDDCNKPIPLSSCHECGTLRCSDQNSKYKVDCSPPNKNFNYDLPGLEVLNNKNELLGLFSLPHNYYAPTCDGLQVNIPRWAMKGLNDIFNNECAERYAQGAVFGDNSMQFDAKALLTALDTSIEQPHCLRRSSRNTGSAVNTDDISNQTIILDRMYPIRQDIMWNGSEEKGRDNEPSQPFITQDTYGQGSDIEPELIAVIHSESGVGGQIAFQTWPVSYDTDEFIDIEYPSPDSPNSCRRKRRLKAHGYGVMYPFIDDPIWQTDDAITTVSDLSGGNAYNFPVYLPGQNYKVGDTIEFKFWQTLDDPTDIIGNSWFREVVIASGVVTEVNSTGGIVWYEFTGDPITGDCPCTKDKYCGGLSNYCYPESHPFTEDGLEGSCYRGEPLCDTLDNPLECTFGESIFTGSNCYPISRPWELDSAGYAGRSSCSGLAENGVQAVWQDGVIIPSKAPKYYYSWLPEPGCFFNADELFLEYFTLENTREYNFNGEQWPACSPLIKVYEKDDGSLNVKTRYKDYYFNGLSPCRKNNDVISANTLFVAYSGGSGVVDDVINTNTTRTIDNYCRVYGFYQQKQYDCGLNYRGQFVMRAQGCEPTIGTVDVSFTRREAKTDITISAPVNQDYILPEYLPEPINGLVEAGFPFLNGEVDKWQGNTPLGHTPDPRNNCLINLKKYYDLDVIEYDCDEYCIPEFDGFGEFTGWNCTYESYQDYNYTNVFGDVVIAKRTNFRGICGYPWEKDCKTTSNEDFKDPTPECFVDSSGNLECNFLDDNGNLSNITKDDCNPFCMLTNTSAIINVAEIERYDVCPNSSYLIKSGDSILTDNYNVEYTYKIPLYGTQIPCLTPNLDNNGPNYFVVWAYGKYGIDASLIADKIEEYLTYWADRYSSLGLDLPGWRALYPPEPFDYPVDYNLKMFFGKIFEIEGVGRVKILWDICFLINWEGGPEETIRTFIDRLAGQQILSHGLGGGIKSLSILNPGDGYAFEVEERSKPTGVSPILDIDLSVVSKPLDRKRKSETWTIESYNLSHTGDGYNIGDTIPIYFNDSDAIRGGVQYKSVPTLEVTDVNISGQIISTSIISSGSYYKWIKTGHHRAYPITVSINNYWEGPDGVTGLGRNAELHPVVDVRPEILVSGEMVKNDSYGRIVDVRIAASGLDYIPNGKYWLTQTSFNGLGLEHLVDPCKYDMDALDPVPVFFAYDGGTDDGTRAGWRYVAPPVVMNGGNVLKWSDRADSWNNVIYSGLCPIPLMNRTYSMALTESVDLIQASCTGPECEAISASFYNYFNNNDGVGNLLCNRHTGFYGDAFNIIDLEGGDDIPWPRDSMFGPIISIARSVGRDPRSGLRNGVPGCYVPVGSGTCSGGDTAVDGGRSNPNDECSGGNEYTIVGTFGGANGGNYHLHRIYKMGGENITMTISE
jgi:hypothetical protein